MGACGGRYCAAACAAILARATGRPVGALPPVTARPSLRPVPLSALAGSFSYESLPFPAPTSA